MTFFASAERLLGDHVRVEGVRLAPARREDAVELVAERRRESPVREAQPHRARRAGGDVEAEPGGRLRAGARRVDGVLGAVDDALVERVLDEPALVLGAPELRAFVMLSVNRRSGAPFDVERPVPVVRVVHGDRGGARAAAPPPRGGAAARRGPRTTCCGTRSSGGRGADAASGPRLTASIVTSRSSGEAFAYVTKTSQ